MRRVLPKVTVTRDEVTSLARSKGWQYHDMYVADGHQPFEKVWLTADGRTGIHWIEDQILELDYLVVEGDRVDEIARSLREDLDTFGRDELRALVEGACEWHTFLYALHHVAAAAPPAAEPELLTWFERGFTHEEPAVRNMTAILTSYPAWPELHRPLERLLGDDDDNVRATAARMLEHLRT